MQFAIDNLIGGTWAKIALFTHIARAYLILQYKAVYGITSTFFINYHEINDNISKMWSYLANGWIGTASITSQTKPLLSFENLLSFYVFLLSVSFVSCTTHSYTYTMLQINIKLLCLYSIQFVMITLRILSCDMCYTINFYASYYFGPTVSV